MGVQHYREYNGFHVAPEATALPDGGYNASVTLALKVGDIAMQTSFDLPTHDLLKTRDEALQQAMQYGFDLVDGFVHCFDPERFAWRGQVS